MSASLPHISLGQLFVAFVPTLALLLVLLRWSQNWRQAVYANLRMLGQLFAIGYVLVFLFETDEPAVVGVVLGVMLAAGAWISLQPLAERNLRLLLLAFAALTACGGSVLLVVTQWVVDLPRWFEPRFVIPLAGMIFSNAMNTMSLAAERFEQERRRQGSFIEARGVAMQAAMIPQVNALLAVGLVSLPGMMTGQILSGTDPLVAARYQIVVMCMVFSSGGLAAAAYLQWLPSLAPEAAVVMGEG